MSAASPQPDFCVIGAGAAGLALATEAVATGASVVLIEKAETPGGAHPRRAGAAMAAMIEAGRLARSIERGRGFGVGGGQAAVEPRVLRDHLRRLAAAEAPEFSPGRLAALGIQVINAAARFVSRDAVEAGGVVVKAKKFVVATGARPDVPGIPGLETTRFLTTDSIFDLEEIPAEAIIVGDDPRGLEIAQIWRRLGARATVLASRRPLDGVDPELADIALARLRAEGVDIVEYAAIRRVEPLGAAGVRVVFTDASGERTLDGSHILVAAGACPNVEGLGLEAAGVAFDRDGIKVDARLRTRNPRVAAIGDAIGGPASVHAARQHARVVIAGGEFEPARVPRVVYLDPEIAMVGLDETAARGRHGALRVARAGFARNEAAVAAGNAHGHVKALYTPNGRIVGVGIVGRGAVDLIVPWQLALAKGLTIHDMADVVPGHPSLSETTRVAALSARPSGNGGERRRPWRFLKR